MATFTSAVGALRCADAIRAGLGPRGLAVRVGVHTGEVKLVEGDIRGVAVHAAAGIMALAGASEILTSSVTRALAESSGLRFRDRGSHEVKGFDRPVDVFVFDG